MAEEVLLLGCAAWDEAAGACVAWDAVPPLDFEADVYKRQPMWYAESAGAG